MQIVAASSQGTNTQQYFEAEISANHPRLQQQHNVHQQPLQTSQQQEQLMPSSPVGLGLGSPMPDFLNPKKSLTLTVSFVSVNLNFILSYFFIVARSF